MFQHHPNHEPFQPSRTTTIHSYQDNRLFLSCKDCKQISNYFQTRYAIEEYVKKKTGTRYGVYFTPLYCKLPFYTENLLSEQKIAVIGTLNHSN